MEGAVDLALPQEAAPPPLSVRRTVVGWIVAAGDVAVEVDNSEPIANIVRSADSTPLSLEMSPPALVNGSECGKKRKLHNNEKQIHITSGGVYMYRDVSPASWVCKLGVTNNIAGSWRRGIARVRLPDVPERVCMRVVEDPVPVQCKTKYDKSEEAA